jgi:CRP/FNR family transcriptional regulator
MIGRAKKKEDKGVGRPRSAVVVLKIWLEQRDSGRKILQPLRDAPRTPILRREERLQFRNHRAGQFGKQAEGGDSAGIETGRANRMTQTLAAEFKQAALVNILGRCPVFEGLPSHDLAAVASIAILKSLRRGEYLFLEDSRLDGLYVVQSGGHQTLSHQPQRSRTGLQVFRPIESFGEEMVASETGYPADAAAAEDSQVLLIPKRQLTTLMKGQRELAFRLLKSAGRRVCHLMGLVDDLILKDAPTRLANWLIHHCPEPNSFHPQRIELGMTKHLLALELGIASETLSRTFLQFRTRRLLDVQGRFVTLMCPARLNEFVRQKLDAPSVQTISPLWTETANAA